MTGNTLLDLAILDVAILLACFVVERRTRRAGIVDAGWSFAIMASALYSGWAHVDGDPLTRLFFAVAGGLWFGRLGLHLLRRYLGESHEDGRYARMRAASGGHDGLVFFVFFLFQAGLAWFFSLPIWALTRVASETWGAQQPLVLALAGLLMLVAWLGETLADSQLTRFRSEPGNRGRTLRTGLWAWSRHPNYFFEWLHWLAYPLVGSLAGLYLLWFYPLCMFLFLYYITGIPFCEQQALSSRGDDYRRYQQETPIFFPRRPRS